MSLTLPGVATAIDGLDVDTMRRAIQDEYSLVANEPERGFHFHTGRRLAALLEYEEAWLHGIPEPTIASFAGTGNPFLAGMPSPGENVVDVGCGAGIDSMIAASFVAPNGRVIGVDMTPAMVEKAQRSAADGKVANVEFRQGIAESLPVSDEWADVVISNGVLNLLPDKLSGLREMARVLKPEGRLQIGDILVQKAVFSEREARHRSLEGLNRRRSAGGRDPEHRRRCWFRCCRDSQPDRRVRRCTAVIQCCKIRDLGYHLPGPEGKGRRRVDERPRGSPLRASAIRPVAACGWRAVLCR